MEHIVKVKWSQPARTPSVGPKAPAESGRGLASMTVSDAGDRGTTTITYIVQADDVAAAEAEARRLAEPLALQFSITAEPTFEVTTREALAARPKPWDA